MITSQKGIELIKQHEGLRLKAYKCPAGVWTIGYGHAGKDVTPGLIITEQQAEQLLVTDLRDFEKQLNGLNLKINQSRFDALISFIYNIGFAAFQGSTLLKVLRVNPDSEEIAYQFSRWNKSKGTVLPGLVKRRKAEAELYFNKG